MANNYYERGDRLNVYLAAELPEEMTGQQDTRRICGNCAWYSFRKLESTCGKTGREVAYFATKECFTTEKDTTMEENTNAQPVAETGTQVCKECGRTLPLEDFQRRRYGKRDKVCKACRAEKIRVGMATGKEKKEPEGVAIVLLCRYLVEFKMAGLALWGEMPSKEEDIKEIIAATKWALPFCKDIFAAAAELKRDGANVVPALVAKRLGGVGQMFVEDLGSAFYPLAEECDTSEQKATKAAEEPVVILKTADFSDDALLEELRRRGYKGTITKVQEVEL